jgi:hypothetical protein
MSNNFSSPDVDLELALQLQQLVDGQCSPQQEAVLLDRLSHDERTQQLWEEITSNRSLLSDALAGWVDRTIDVRVAVLCDVAALVAPESSDSAQWLSQAVHDGEASEEQIAGLHRLVSTGHDETVIAALSSAQPMVAMQAIDAPHALVPAVVTAVAAIDEQRWLQMRQLDQGTANDVISADVLAWAAIGDVLQTAVRSPHHRADAARAGQAALQVIAASSTSASQPAAPLAPVAQPSWWQQVVRGRGIRFAGIGLATAGAAGLMLTLRTEVPAIVEDLSGDAESILAQLPEPAELTTLALLDDNSADVETIDGGTTTLVYFTAASNVTIIWVTDDDDAAQGT